MNGNVFETKCNVDFLYFLEVVNVNALLLELFPHQTYHFNRVRPDIQLPVPVVERNMFSIVCVN